MMRIEDVGAIPVCESGQSRRLVGIVTDRDLALQVVAEARDANRTKVHDVMTKAPFACHPDDNLQNALQAMQRKQVRRIPVVDRDGELSGIISQADIALGTEPETVAEVVGKISKPSTARAA
jgi:CBS domain-containing protein